MTQIALIELNQGDSKVITAIVETAEGTPEDISTYDFIWRLWHILTGTVLQKTVGVGIEILDQNTKTGQLTITLDAEDTIGLAPLTYEHQLCVIYTDYTQMRMNGYIQVSSTRPAKVTP